MTESIDSLAVKDIISVASPFIKSLVDTFVTPKLVAFRDRNKAIDGFIPTENDFNEYYHRTYKKLMIINTLVFNNSQRFLTDVYIPLTIRSTNEPSVKAKINGFPKKISEEYGNILITDTAGMGKSTLLKRIFLDIVDNNYGIPLFVELRRLNKQKKLISEIQEQLSAINKDFNTNSLLNLLSEGGFVIILDGYDEISLSDRDLVTKDMQEFISKAANNLYFVSSRPEKALASFGNFLEFKIDPLTKKEAFELLRKYDNQGKNSLLLIKKLQETELENIEEFLTNPLLVSLLFTAFEHKQAIPFKKYLFYRQVYDANFESHDLTKGDSYIHDKYSKLEIDDFHRVLRHLGYSCFKLQKIEFAKDELLKLITESKLFCVGLQFKESSFLEDIIRTVPIFTQDGNYYRWAHKSLQEYFAAQFIFLDSKDHQSDILLKMYNHPNIDKFVNILDLYYDMDYKTFRNVIEFSILEEYEKFAEKQYNHDYLDVSKNEVVRRKEVSFLTHSAIFQVKEIDREKELFDDKLVTKIIDEYQKANNISEDKFTGILISPVFLKDIWGVHFEDGKHNILVLLRNKKNPIVKRLNNRKFGLRPTKSLTFSFEKDYELKVVDDTVDNLFNSAPNFSLITDFLIQTKMYNFMIDHVRSLRRLREIRKSIQQGEKDKDFLMGF